RRDQALSGTLRRPAAKFKTLPLPGDSGSPIIQNGKVVGILASVFYTNANAIAISLDQFII
ncbi:MAG: hypothetical protein ACXVHS_11430, partial [Methanobacterium sp.]